MKVNVWIQMGCERREVTFHVCEGEIERVGGDELESYIEDLVLDWMRCRYGWGWSRDFMTNDFSVIEDDESPSLEVTNEVLNPRTQELQYNLELAEGDRHGGAKEGNALSGGALHRQHTPGSVTMNGASHDDIERALLELEQLGLLERTGRLRNGEPVWVVTALCKRLEETAPEQMKSTFN